MKFIKSYNEAHNFNMKGRIDKKLSKADTEGDINKALELIDKGFELVEDNTALEHKEDGYIKLSKKVTNYFNNLNKQNERFTPKLVDKDGDGYYEVDLDVKNIRLKEDTFYEFLNVHFNIQYNSTSNNYHSIIQYPDTNDGTEQYVGWVIYGKTIEDMTKKLRFQIKMYVKKFGKN